MKLNCQVPRGGGGPFFILGTLLLLIGGVGLWSGSRIVPSSAGPFSVPDFVGQQEPAAESSANAPSPATVFSSMPLGFEPNQGQTDQQVRFLARGRGYTLFLTGNEAVLKLQESGVRSEKSGVRNQEPGVGRKSKERASIVRMHLVGADPSSKIVGTGRLSSVSNYFLGNDPSKWRSDVPQFARVRYQQVYPGVDLVYYGNQGQLEYDFEVAPGADPRMVQLQFESSHKLAVDSDGDLVVHAGGGDLQFHAPEIYQQIGEERRKVDGKFVVGASNRVGFKVGNYDRSRTLVIDPVLNYSSYLGGSGNESGATVAVDAAFNFYVTGATTSGNFPPQPGVFGSLTGAQNVFVSKFGPGGNLIASTYLGGTGTDSSAGIAIDAASNIFVAGTTTSANFPTMNGFTNPPLSPAPASHAFVTTLKPDLSGLTYSTLLGGNGTDTVSGLAIDTRGKAYIIGVTTPTSGQTPDFPTTAGSIQPQPLSITDPQFFVSKIDPTLSGGPSLAYSTYFGGGNPVAGTTPVQGGGIATDTNAFVYITGGTTFQHVGAATDFPILNAVQGALNCASANCSDVFVAKINPAAGSGAQILYSTYLGGGQTDIGHGIAVDTGGNAYVTGSTTSPNFSTLTTGFQPCLGKPLTPSPCTGIAAQNAFVAKLNNPATNSTVSLTYFSYLGGTASDTGLAIAVDTSGVTRVIGNATSSDFPSFATSGFTPGPLGAGDAFVARIDTVSTSNFSSRFGGSALDHGSGVALDSNFNTYVAGDTQSGDFPTAGPPFQPGLSGPSDAWVARLGSLSDLAITGVTSSAPSGIGVGNPVTFTYTIKNNGPDSTAGVAFTDNLPASGATFTSISSTPGTCTPASGGHAVCSIGTLGTTATATVSVVLTPTVASSSFQNSGSVSAGLASTDLIPGNNFGSLGVPVTDYAVAVTPATQTVQAGNSTTYQVQISPVPSFPNSVALTCSAGLPAGAACTFSTTPVTLSNNSPASSTLTITTTARPVTTALWHGSRIWYAMFLPVSGLAFLGFGFGGRKKRVLGGLLLLLGLCGIVFMLACGSSRKSTPTVNQGTPAGTYTVTVTGTSGSASHGATTVLVVQ